MKDALADNIKRHQEIQPVPAPELQVEESESFRRAHNDRYIRENPGHSPAQGGGIFLVGVRPSVLPPLAPAMDSAQPPQLRGS